MADPARYDLIFIGGGVSGTLTLIQVLDELRGIRPSFSALRPARQWRIAVVDSRGAFGGGVPYGNSIHPMLLLNNDVASMDVRGFHGWLDANRDRWLDMLHASPSPAVASWLYFNHRALAAARSEREHYHSLFLPRCVFGLFMSDILANAQTQAHDVPASVELIKDDVVSIARVGNGFLLGLRDSSSLGAEVVVLGVGSLQPDPAPALEGTPAYVHDLNPGGCAPLASMLQGLSTRVTKPSLIAIIGSHASAMEAIYTIAFDHNVDQFISEIMVISPSGRLPEATSSGILVAFDPKSLNSFMNRTTVSADDIITAALRDAEGARRTGYSSVDYSPPLCSAFGRVFGLLTATEKRRFVEEFGMQFTALNRHTPPEYAAAASRLLQKEKLRLISAEVTAVDPPNATTSDFTVTFRSASGLSEQLCAAGVINCRGSGILAHTSNLLLRNILRPHSGIAQSNHCGKGIAVSQDFEASPGLFVAGPLLAGHSYGSDHLWNLERAERIDWVARRIAPAIAARLTSYVQTIFQQ